MAGAGAGAGADQQLVGLAGGDDLVDQRIDRGAAAVDDALSADLEHRRVRQDPEVRRCLRRRQKLRVGQRTLHEERLELRGCCCHRGITFRFTDACRDFSAGSQTRPKTGAPDNLMEGAAIPDRALYRGFHPRHRPKRRASGMARSPGGVMRRLGAQSWGAFVAKDILTHLKTRRDSAISRRGAPE